MAHIHNLSGSILEPLWPASPNLLVGLPESFDLGEAITQEIISPEAFSQKAVLWGSCTPGCTSGKPHEHLKLSRQHRHVTRLAD